MPTPNVADATSVRAHHSRHFAAWLPGHGVCIALYASSIVVFLASPLGHRWPTVDLEIYRLGGQAVLNGAHLYALRFPGALAFTYPPLSALAFTLLTFLAMAVLKPALAAISICLLAAMLYFTLGLAPISSWLTRDQAFRLALLVGAAALWLEPVWTTLRYGQINILIATLILYDLSRPDASRLKGAAIGLAIGLKLTPGIFAVYLILTRRYRAAAVSLGTFGATIAVGFAALPGDSAEFWGGAFMDPKRIGRIENAANQTLRGAYARLLHTMDVQTWWLSSAIVVGVVGLVLAARAGRRGDDATGFSLVALSGLLISPVSWSHHWVLILPALLVLAMKSYVHRWVGGIAGVALAAIVGYSQMIWWVPVNHPRHSELHLGGIELLYSNAYVLLGLLALFTALLWAVGPRWPAFRMQPTALARGDH